MIATLALYSLYGLVILITAFSTIQFARSLFRFLRFTISLRHIPKHKSLAAIYHLVGRAGIKNVLEKVRNDDGSMQPVVDYGLFPGCARVVGVADPDEIEFILQSDYQLFPDYGPSYDILRECNGKGIAGLKTSKSIVRIFSSFTHLKYYSNAMESIFEIAKEVINNIKVGDDINIINLVTEYVVKCMNSIFFGGTLDWKTIVEAQIDLVDISKDYIRSRLLFGKIWSCMPFGSNKRRKVARVKLKSAMLQRLCNLKQDPIGNSSQFDIMSLLYTHQQAVGDITDEEILKTCTGIMYSGLAVTVASLSWVIYEMAKHPKFRVEIQKEASGYGGNHPIKDLSKLSFASAFVKESLRLNPPMPAVNRIAMKDCEIGGLFIPAGTPVCLMIWNIQRSERYWENGNEFIPERFMSGSPRHSYCYIPFSAGPKSCIGKKHGLNMMLAFTTVLASQFEIHLDKEREVVDEYRCFIYPIGLHCKFSKYNNRASLKLAHSNV